MEGGIVESRQEFVNSQQWLSPSDSSNQNNFVNNENNISNLSSVNFNNKRLYNNFYSFDQVFSQGSASFQSFSEIHNYIATYFDFLINNFDWDYIFSSASHLTQNFYAADYAAASQNANLIISRAEVYSSKFSKRNFQPFSDNIIWFDQQQILDLDQLSVLPVADLASCDLSSIYSQSKKGKQFCIIDVNLRRKIINFIRPFYEDLNAFDKKLIEKLVIGFSENINYEVLSSFGNNNWIEKPSKKDNKKVLEYLRAEEDLKRVRPISFSSIPRFPANNFFSCRIIPIAETKFKDGKPYQKDRFVINACRSNLLVKPPFVHEKQENLPERYFSTPSPESLFTHDHLFFNLVQSKHVSVFDRASFYRQWRMSAPFWPAAIQTSLNQDGSIKYWLDYSGRMGNKFSAHVAQSIVTMVDKIFSLHQSESFAITNQDDSLLLQSTFKSAEIYRLINESLGISFNEEKTQLMATSATWCGFTFCLTTKTVSLKQKRLEKFRKKLQEILSKDLVTRREIARILGMIWSGRLLFFGSRILLNPALYFTRKSSKIFRNYVEEEELKNKEWDTEIEVNNLLKNELLCCSKVMDMQVPMWNVREGFRNHHQIKEAKLPSKSFDMEVHSDASADAAGIGLKVDGQAFSFHYKFSRQTSGLSINVKELDALIMGYFVAIIYKKIFMGSRKMVNVVFFVDNRCAEMIALSRKAAAKNGELSVLAKSLCDLERTFSDVRPSFMRIDTVANTWADKISRSTQPQMDFKQISSLLDALWLILGSRSSSTTKTLQKIIPTWLGPANAPPTTENRTPPTPTQHRHQIQSTHSPRPQDQSVAQQHQQQQQQQPQQPQQPQSQNFQTTPNYSKTASTYASETGDLPIPSSATIESCSFKNI